MKVEYIDDRYKYLIDGNYNEIIEKEKQEAINKTGYDIKLICPKISEEDINTIAKGLYDFNYCKIKDSEMIVSSSYPVSVRKEIQNLREIKESLQTQLKLLSRENAGLMKTIQAKLKELKEE